jgi:Thioredoxin-like
MLIKSITIFSIFASAFLLLSNKNVINSTQKSDIEIAISNPELGTVNWQRDLDAATLQAKNSGKLLLILFDEIPGCSNCTRFGKNTLSHPLIAEAIETFFIPVCIHNNKGGKDAEILKKFGEPSWNNPVVRIVRADNHADVVLRMDNFNSSWQIINGIRRALDLNATAAPIWLESLENELLALENGTETATFSMYCFWSGEGTFGSIDGVVATEPGFQDGAEVVKVIYNPAVVKKSELTAKASPKGIKACQKNEGFRADNEPKYYLSKTNWQYVPMTPSQASRANSLVGEGKSPEEVFSLRQLALAKYIKENPKKKWKSRIGEKDLVKAWADSQNLMVAGK